MRSIQFILPVCFCLFFLETNAQLVINEYSCANLKQYIDDHNDYEDWFELYNGGAAAVNLQNYYLSDDSTKKTKWQIKSTVNIPAGGFVRIWCSGRDTIAGANLHAGFKLTQTKNGEEDIVLSNPSGTIIDFVHLLRHQLGHSVGRTTNGAATWSIFTNPTPNASNNTARAYARYAAKASLDTSSGFYPAALNVTVTPNEPNSVTYYTINGFEPRTTSATLSGSILIDSTRVLKTRTFSNDTNVLPSLMTFHTFFIRDTFTLPVISVASDSLLILLNNLKKAARPYGSVEYFGVNRKRKATAYGEFNSHGQDSWVHNQRSFDIVVRDEMGYNNVINEQIFEQTPRDKFQRLILRAAGDDNFSPPIYQNKAAHIRDAYIQNLAKKGNLALDVRTAAKSIVFVNGIYWGVYDIRELPDDHDYTEYYYNQGKYEIDYLLTWGSTWAEYGGTPAINKWNTFKDWILTNNMADTNNYNYVTDNLDVQSLIDYIMVNTFTNCTDWINYNTGWWRGYNPNGTHKKWGYILWDNDATFNFYINYTGIQDKSAKAKPCQHFLISPANDRNQHLEIAYKLLESPKYRKLYEDRYKYMAKVAFSCDTMLNELNKVQNILDPEMPRHCARWGVSYPLWKQNVDTLRNFIASRCVFLADTNNYCDDDTIKKVTFFNKSYSPTPALRGYNMSVKGSAITDTIAYRKYWQKDTTFFTATKQNATDSTKVFRQWRSLRHNLKPSSTSLSAGFRVMESDTVNLFYVNLKTDLRRLGYTNPLLAKYRIVHNGLELSKDSTFNVYVGDSINIRLKSIDTSAYVFNGWKSKTGHVLRPSKYDTIVSFVITQHDTIQVEYILKDSFLLQFKTLKFNNARSNEFDIVSNNKKIIRYDTLYYFRNNDSVSIQLKKTNPSGFVFKKWLNKANPILSSALDTSIYIKITANDTFDVAYFNQDSFQLLFKKIKFNNPLESKYAIAANQLTINRYDTLYEYKVGDSIRLELKKKDTTLYQFVQWKSSKHNFKPQIKDSIVYFFVVEHDTIEVQYMLADTTKLSLSDQNNTVVNIYPSIFRDELHVVYKGSISNADISLIDMQGRVAKKIRANHLFEGDNHLKFSDAGLTEGYYYLLIKASENNYLMKLYYR